MVDANWPESELIDYPLTDEEQKEIDKAVSQAKQADVAIVVLGGGQRTCGENKSRSSLDLPGRQLDLLKAVVATPFPRNALRASWLLPGIPTRFTMDRMQ